MSLRCRGQTSHQQLLVASTEGRGGLLSLALAGGRGNLTGAAIGLPAAERQDYFGDCFKPW
ncbi:hypothetical protein [Schlesneria sp. T3-172]|uniref:hypothetical protein n=1 Tax=Schlesneria sphaerica TaxID=3373610 RepID=UPI0037C50AAB